MREPLFEKKRERIRLISAGASYHGTVNKSISDADKSISLIIPDDPIENILTLVNNYRYGSISLPNYLLDP